MVQLFDAVKSLESWSRGTALIVQGQGSSFCSGVDLQLARETLVGGSEGALMSELLTGTLNSLRRLPLVSVAALTGPAVGGGAELATACDYRVMHQSSHIRFVQAKMGTSTGFGGSARLVSLIGRRNALKLLLVEGKAVYADEALKMGLVDMIASPGHSGGDANVGAQQFLRRVLHDTVDRAAVRNLKSAVAAADDIDVEIERRETALFSQVWGGDANRNAIISHQKK